MKVYGGLHSGRVLELPEDSRAGDYVTLPESLPAGEMFQSGRTVPERHLTKRTYRLVQSTYRSGSRSSELYLAATIMAPRFIRSVTVPPAALAGITITL